MNPEHDWREHGPEVAHRQYFAWSMRHPDADRAGAFDAGFARGARWAVSTSGALSPAIASMVDLIDWLRRVEQEDRAIDWAMSNAMAEEHAIADQEQESLPF